MRKIWKDRDKFEGKYREYVKELQKEPEVNLSELNVSNL